MNSAYISITLKVYRLSFLQLLYLVQERAHLLCKFIFHKFICINLFAVQPEKTCFLATDEEKSYTTILSINEECPKSQFNLRMRFGPFFTFLDKGRIRFFFVSGEKTRLFRSRSGREIRTFWPLTRKWILLDGHKEVFILKFYLFIFSKLVNNLAHNYNNENTVYILM